MRHDLSNIIIRQIGPDDTPIPDSRGQVHESSVTHPTMQPQHLLDQGIDTLTLVISPGVGDDPLTHRAIDLTHRHLSQTVQLHELDHIQVPHTRRCVLTDDHSEAIWVGDDARLVNSDEAHVHPSRHQYLGRYQVVARINHHLHDP
jgi:hypothetical protein